MFGIRRTVARGRPYAVRVQQHPGLRLLGLQGSRLRRQAGIEGTALSQQPVAQATLPECISTRLQRRAFLTVGQGLALLGVAGPAQDVHIKIISDTLADAFLSKTEAIPQVRIDAMAERLASLEDFVLDETTGDLPLDPGASEMMLGMDAASVNVLVDGDAKPAAEMLAWAQGLQTGSWFTLDHNGQTKPVQFAWHSNRKQLFLFAAMDGSCHLIQLRRLGTYLQAGLLRPQEEEALTQRATRDALGKLEANPERLLH